MTRNEAASDTLVIGGGVVGAALAWGLARAGERVTVLDDGDIVLRASRGNFGLVWVQSKGANMFDYARWTRRSADLWPEFAAMIGAETGLDLAYEKPGGMHFMLSETELEAARARNFAMKDVTGPDDYGAEIVDRHELDKIFPGLGPDVIGGSYGHHDGHVNPLKLLRCLHLAMEARGVRYVSNARVESVAKDGAGFTAETAKGRFSAAKVVLAAGHGTTELAPALGLDMPLRPEKGQILVTERCATRLLPMPTHVLRQTDEGTVLIGDSHENTGYSTASYTPVLTDIARHALRCFPALAALKVVRSWGCVRVLSPDGCPVYHASETCPGAFAIACHSGVTLAAAHAMELAGVIASGSFGDRFAAFHPRRFSHAQAH